ncbi:hypothetical protein B0H67DRAFT_550674 [Lasiosphaeris hirsuta]|uniref:Nudix hydrolase domain-containing protein n=1 Tax=Lasiosphaeris hirsuta TaxID=260670 RepID=A0AA40AZY3_9PEZI|nr:hypothetical protein B0H67DRAFT_550674 [Lasiosphaeris hirsuta]
MSTPNDDTATTQITIPSLLPSSNFYLAAGTITLDPHRCRLLTIHNPTTHITKLPRGHQDWDEPLPLTARRETLEETGVHPTLLAVPLSTRCTAPTSSDHALHAEAGRARWDEAGDVLLEGSARLVEPVAMMTHYQPDGALAVVFWYVALADSEAGAVCEPEAGCEARWVGYEEGVRAMVNGDYVKVIQQAIRLVGIIEEMDGPLTWYLTGAQHLDNRE